MSLVYKSIKQGLQEAIDFSKRKKVALKEFKANKSSKQKTNSGSLTKRTTPRQDTSEQ